MSRFEPILRVQGSVHSRGFMQVFIRSMVMLALVIAPSVAYAQVQRVQSQWGDTARMRTALGWRRGVLEFTPGDQVTLVQGRQVTRVPRDAILDFQVQRGTRRGPGIAPYLTGLLGLALGTLAGAVLAAPAEAGQGQAAAMFIGGGALLGLTGGVKLGLSIGRAQRPIWVAADPP